MTRSSERLRRAFVKWSKGNIAYTNIEVTKDAFGLLDLRRTYEGNMYNIVMIHGSILFVLWAYFAEHTCTFRIQGVLTP